MNFVVFGIDHRMQASDPGLEAVLRSWLDKQFFEPLIALAEEYKENIGESIAQRLANERGLRWYNVDMTSEEKAAAGILEEQRNRPGMFEEKFTYRLPSDDVREDAWTKKLTESTAPGTTLVICGYLHFESLVGRLRSEGHTVDKRVFLETVPEIRFAQSLRVPWITTIVEGISDQIAEMFRKMIEAHSVKQTTPSPDQLISLTFLALETFQSQTKAGVARLVQEGTIPESAAGGLTINDADLFAKLLAAIEAKLKG